MAVAARGDGVGQSTDVTRRWDALQESAAILVRLAGIEPERESALAASFPATIRQTAHWRRDLAERAVEDLAASLRPGLAALLRIEARGDDPRTAALALWREFTAARAALLDALPPEGAMDQQASA